MSDTKTVRIYESDIDAIEDLATDGNFPAKVRQVVHMAENYKFQTEEA